MLARESVRSRFRELEKRIEELTRSVIPQEANSRDSNALVSDQSSSAEELRIGEIRVSSPAIIIPGIAQARQPLIVPISEDTEQQEGSTTATDTRVESSVVDELVAAIEAPLAKLGLRKQRYLKGLAGGGACTWVGWWLDESVDLKEADGILKYIGPWFIKSVVGSLSPVLFLEPPAISKEQQEELLLPYIISDPSNGTSISCSWQITASIVGALASRSSGASGSPAALTLVTRLLDKAAASGQLGPRLALQRIGSIEPQRASTARSSFGEYLQLACTLPERIANKIDPQSIPASLLPHSYFSQLAKQAIECSDTANYSNDRASSKDAKPGLVAELWTKLCRVGQLDCLCVELAIALLAAADERICGSASASDDRLSKLAAMLANVPMPFQGRLLNGVVRQMDAMGSRAVAGSGERYEFGMQMALVICAILHRIFDQNNSDADIDKAIASLITRDGAAGGGSVAKRSTITYQAISLALQILGGNCPANDLPVGSARVFPDLVPGVLGRCILPMWSYAELVEHGRNDEVKCLTMLILMCVGALSSQSRTELSMSAAFTRAIPRFLDAPSPLIRLSGIIVADAIVNSDPKRSEVDGEVIDFGLDDIIRDAKQPVGGQQIVRESAEYIISMRRYKQSIAAQWKDDVADEDAKKQARNENGGKSLDEAAKYIRAYSGIDKADSVLAPRQSSMVANGQDELRSQYVKPRTPVFLRDCLAYLKDQGESSNAERVKIGLFALADCIERADTKAVEELWLKVANKVLYTYNRGPDDVDWMWDMERRRALVALAVRLPEVLGPFLADP
ncbi:hypothetical protein GGI12_001221 [Dipsacomyces acuminosporus]|nr:hypothetical protein GGI12_001221 [Dipsacomyces acuminosporus]